MKTSPSQPPAPYSRIFPNLKYRFFSVRVGSYFCFPTEIKVGVPRDVVIAHLFFNLFIADLSRPGTTR